ncbi:MAG: peptidoglycan-binding domain-containing protein [Propionibacteriaceae bacterium]|nr:peptidoglycan-binding domain-containing protein [Propionibacteriaceae bacterium]
MRRVGSAVLALVALAVAVFAGWWAASATLTSSDPGAESPLAQAVWAEAVEGSVGRSLAFATTLRQPSNPVAANGLSGVVTSVHVGEVASGDAVYVVGDTPVRVVEAQEPFWRELGRGARGDDVAALQGLLTGLGYFEGEVGSPFGPETERAVKAWQKAEGRVQSGVVQLGELVGLPRLPVTIALGEDIVVGARLAGGETAVLAPTGEREFVLVLSEDQGRLVPTEATVEISYEDSRWVAVIAGSRVMHGSMEFDLVGADGGEVCGSECDKLPVDPQVTLRSQVVVVPRIMGVAVPAAAILTDSAGATEVVTEAGPLPVTVLGSGQGLVIVEGLEAGTRVQISPATTTAAAADDAGPLEAPSTAPNEGE